MIKLEIEFDLPDGVGAAENLINALTGVHRAEAPLYAIHSVKIPEGLRYIYELRHLSATSCYFADLLSAELVANKTPDLYKVHLHTLYHSEKQWQAIADSIDYASALAKLTEREKELLGL